MDSSSPQMNRASRYLRTYAAGLLIIGAFGVGILVGHGFFQKSISHAQDIQNGNVILNLNAPSVTSTVDFQEFWTVWNRIKDQYVKDGVKDQDLFYGSLQGLVASLGDPHSVFLPPQQADQFGKDLSGEFDGIGAEIGLKNEQLVVISPLADSPAEKAGLRAGDRILAIDKLSTFGIDTVTAVSKIRGPAGTPVVLTVGRDKAPKPLEIKIIRAKIVAPSLVSSIKNGNIAYIRLSQFNQDTTALLNEAISKFPKKIKGIVLDLRNDPGGFLNVAVEVASKWVPTGDLIVEEKGRSGIMGSFKSSGDHPFKDVKTVILINKGSASASEIVAGALQDYKIATLVGETSYGKGSVQDLQNFADGSALKLTIAEWYTPFGRNINKEGIKPDVEVKVDWNKEKVGQDAVLAKALQIINGVSSTKK